MSSKVETAASLLSLLGAIILAWPVFRANRLAKRIRIVQGGTADGGEDRPAMAELRVEVIGDLQQSHGWKPSDEIVLVLGYSCVIIAGVLQLSK